MITNERGLTLIEVLATIVLTFIIGSLVFSVTHTTIENYQQSELRSKAQTDSNRLIHRLTSIHQTAYSYTIEQETDSVIHIERDNGETYTFDGSPLQYELAIEGSTIEHGVPVTIPLSETLSINFSVQVTQTDNPRFRPLTISTRISRITPAGSGGEFDDS
ncbi:hypothetical protein [Alkalibacillus aidingensis]|uniref:hypothetical protein n=1 Tax=Alkalibacillus aidingensis TaxID=2747607 RepID=UPI0016612813|nr:hypothetical protein [Alkalibacillus aidingensis]